jgi:hypothetical protein
MNTANGVLIVADHDRFFHTSIIIIMVSALQYPPTTVVFVL